MKTFTKTAILIALLLISGVTLAADWSQWRGPKRDGLSMEKGLPASWPKEGPALAWKTRGLGEGFSTVTISGDRIFTAGDIGDSSYIVALNRADGKPLWKTRLGPKGGGPAGPRGTPAVDGNLVFALGQHGDLVCAAADTGKEVWRKHLVKEFGGKCGGWLYSESPLVDGDRLICTPGGKQGTLMAFNKKTGDVLWRCTDWTDSAEYSSAIVETLGGVRQYIQFTGDSVAGVAADNGTLLWRADRPGRTATVPTPIFRDNHVYVTSGYGVGCNLFKITATGGPFKTESVYSNDNMVNHHGGVVLVGRHLYGYSDGKGWICQDFQSGEIVWKNPGVGKGAIAYADGHLYLRGEGKSGTVALIQATPVGYKETGRFDQPERSGSESWAHPVIAGGRLYLRDQDLLLCYDLTAK